MKTLFGAIIVDGRGKLGGHVSQKNTYGTFLRTKTTSVNKRTSSQQAVRAIMADIVNIWGELTEAERTDWNQFASENPVTDIFGRPQGLTGINFFTKINLNLWSIDLPFKYKKDRYSRKERRAYKAWVKGNAATINIEIFPDGVDVATKIALYATSAQSPGISFPGTKFRKIDILDSTTVFPYAIADQLIAKFGAVGVEGQKVFIKLIQIDQASGFAFPPIIGDGIIEATI